MKKAISLLILLLFIVTNSCHAGEKYTVFILKGSVTIQVNGKTRSLKQGDIIDESTIITTAKGSYLTLRSGFKKRYTLTINFAYKGTIKSLKHQQGVRQKRTRPFMILTNGKTSSDFVDSKRRVMSGAGTVYRDTFIDEDDYRALEELREILIQADLIDK